MGYSKYKTLQQVVDKFGINAKRSNIVVDIEPVLPSDWLKRSLEIAESIPLSNEKAKSELVIAPILAEVHQTYKEKLSLFSGAELNVSPEEDLNGACDFFFSAVPDAYLLEAPIVSFTEAKNEDIDYGIAQCVAQMIAAQRFNTLKNKQVDTIWGCATTAIEWKFLKLEETTIYIDKKSYSTENLSNLLGVFKAIFEQINIK